MGLSHRVEKLERAAGRARMQLLHVALGQTEAVAAHRRAHGPIPDNAVVILIHHTFTSAL